MTKKNAQVEIINVQRVTDIATGETVIQVGFGTPIPVTQEILKRFRPDEDAPVPSEVYTNLVQIMLPLSGSEKYTVGSKWALRIKEDGSVSLEKVQE